MLLEKSNPSLESLDYFRPTKSKKPFILTSFVLSLLVMIQNMTLIKNPSPQFSMNIQAGNNESALMLSNLRDGLQMISFLASDFSLSLSNYSLISGIDTFDESNVFKFDYQGYSRYDIEDGQHYRMHNSSGLDIFSDLVMDIGIQLSNVSNSQNPDNLINSLLVTYSHTIMNLDEMFWDGKATGVYTGYFDEKKLRLGRQAYRLEKYGKLMKKYPWVITGLSLLSFILVAFNVLLMNSKALLASNCAQFVQLTVTFCSWASQLRYHYKLTHTFSSSNIASLNFDSGFYYLQVSLIVCIIIQGLLGYTYYKRI